MTAIQQTPALLPPAAADRAAGVRLKSKDERSGINNRSEQSIYPTQKSVLTSGATPGQGFEFLGYRFEAGRRCVRKKTLTAVRDKIRAKTKRNEGHSLEYVIASLNPILRGWYGYFQHAHRCTFSSLDGFIRRRLRAMLRRQKHRPGQGQCLRDHKQWPNAFFADLGLFTMSEAHRLARQSRCGNN
jgi:RNA-directed DNA polymerase